MFSIFGMFLLNSFCCQGPFYVEILQKYLPEIQQMLGSIWCFQQDNNPEDISKDQYA